jgi:integrase
MEGLRAGEALGLQWSDIDLERELLHIRRSAWYGKVQTVKSQASETVLPIPTALTAEPWLPYVFTSTEEAAEAGVL